MRGRAPAQTGVEALLAERFRDAAQPSRAGARQEMSEKGTLMKKLLIAAICALTAAPAALADAGDDAIFARRGYMKMVVLNFGPLGGMVKGDIPYDAATAQTHADNLLVLSSMNMDYLFPAGTDNEAKFGDTRSLPAIWGNFNDFIAKYNAMGAAIDNLAASAGGGQDSLKAAFADVGAACGACHKAYRAKDF